MARRVPVGTLAEFCERLGTSLRAGVDLRRALDTEIAHAAGVLRRPLLIVRQELARGSTLTEALASTNGAFPPLLKDIVQVGEQSGRLDEALQQLASHFRRVRRMRSAFFMAIAWPVAQAVLVVLLLGVLIVVMGIVQRFTGQPADILGFGLTGVSGLIIYLAIVGTAAAVVVAVWRTLNRRALLPYVFSALTNLPGLRGFLIADALARLCWTLSLADASGLDPIFALKLGLQSTGNQRYRGQTDRVVRAVRRGDPLHRALGASGVFPNEFVAAVEVGELSGRLSETLQSLGEQYQQQAHHRSTGVTVVGSILVWAGVASVIIWLIFRIAGSYVNTIQQFAV